MASFVNLLGNDLWSEADIINRTEAMIHAEFPVDQEAIINRIVTAAAAGMYQLTEEEQATVARYNEVCLAARAAGDAARTDNALLAKTLAYEDAQQVIDGAGDDVTALVAQRAAARPTPAPTASPATAVGGDAQATSGA